MDEGGSHCPLKAILHLAAGPLSRECSSLQVSRHDSLHIYGMKSFPAHKDMLIVSSHSDDWNQSSINGTNYVGEICHPQKFLLCPKNFLLPHRKNDVVKAGIQGINDSHKHSAERGLRNTMYVSSLRLKVSFGQNSKSCQHL